MAEDAPDRHCQATPLGGLGHELFAASARERVEARAAGVLRSAPFGGDPLACFEALQRGVERAMLDEQLVTGGLLNGSRDTLAMLWPEDQSSEDEKVKRALEKFQAFPVCLG